MRRDVQLVELIAPTGNRRWVPFDDAAGFKPHWWCTSKSADRRFVKVLLENQEVARVELDDSLALNDLGEFYPGVPVSQKPTVEIQFIEVTPGRRREGIGAAVIAKLDAAHRGHRLAAFSEGADDFWGSLHWDRYVAKQSPQQSRTLFIRP